jgi:hypothetical protein
MSMVPETAKRLSDGAQDDWHDAQDCRMMPKSVERFSDYIMRRNKVHA